MTDPSDVHLAAYAMRSSDFGGRKHPEPDDPLRSPFELDRHRIVECTAFRRLEGKTQVFAPAHHDHFRTRLTHTLEAAQIARTLAVALRANESLAEAITLAHDLGHPPFGHAGEAALSEAMSDVGGFNHNAHSVHVVEYLEHPYPAFRGLNLTGATLAGLRSHETRYDKPATPARADAAGADVTRADTDGTDAAGADAAGADASGGSLNTSPPLQGGDRGGARPRAAGSRTPAAPPPDGASVEAQIASLADRIAYDTHDLEDAIGAELVGLGALSGVTLWQQTFERAVGGAEARGIHAVRRAVLDAILDEVLTDIVATSREPLMKFSSPQAVRELDRPSVTLSDQLERRLSEFETFLHEHIYGHPTVAEMDAEGRDMVLTLFDAYRSSPDTLPRRFAARIDDQGLHRVICDYIAGMTDRFCRAEHKRRVKRT
jgi:dGTPase